MLDSTVLYAALSCVVEHIVYTLVHRSVAYVGGMLFSAIAPICTTALQVARGSSKHVALGSFVYTFHGPRHLERGQVLPFEL